MFKNPWRPLLIIIDKLFSVMYYMYTHPQSLWISKYHHYLSDLDTVQVRVQHTLTTHITIKISVSIFTVGDRIYCYKDRMQAIGVLGLSLSVHYILQSSVIANRDYPTQQNAVTFKLLQNLTHHGCIGQRDKVLLSPTAISNIFFNYFSKSASVLT